MAKRARALEALATGLCLWVASRFVIHGLTTTSADPFLPPKRGPAIPKKSVPNSSARSPLATDVFSTNLTPQPWRMTNQQPLASGKSLVHIRPENPPETQLFPNTENAPLSDLSELNSLPAFVAANNRTNTGARLSFWMLARPDSPPAKGLPATAGTLAASQVGARFTVPLDKIGRSFGLSFRATAPLGRSVGREAAAGLRIHTQRHPNIEILIEERFELDGQHAAHPAVLMAGGFYDVRLFKTFTGEGYFQAGGVRRSKTQLFADARFSATLAVAPNVFFGMGSWGAAQQDLDRIDVGPVLVVRHGKMRISADWRLRIAGNARPGSGPAVALGTDF